MEISDPGEGWIFGCNELAKRFGLPFRYDEASGRDSSVSEPREPIRREKFCPHDIELTGVRRDRKLVRLQKFASLGKLSWLSSLCREPLRISSVASRFS